MSVVNHSSFSTTANSNNIFNVTEAGARFVNQGDLSTTGVLATPIYIGADNVSVANFGAIAATGDGSVGISAGDPLHFANHALITNHGSITTSGGFVEKAYGEFDSYPDGVDLFGDHSRAVNYGSIRIDSPDGAAMASIGADNTLVNHGSIDAAGIGMVLDHFDEEDTGSTALNQGTIHSHGDFSYGIFVLASENTVINRREIQVDGFHSFGISFEGARNHGENYGTILATGEQGRGVLLFGPGHDFLNRGSIISSGLDGVGVRMGGEAPFDFSDGPLTNYGAIRGAGFAVLGSPANETVVNHGELVGDVDLQAGDDLYVAGRGGELQGVLTLGEGDDTLRLEQAFGGLTVADFVAGPGSEDVIDLSALGTHSLAQLLGHASQVGGDVVISFGGSQLALLETSLGSLSADDFLFG